MKKNSKEIINILVRYSILLIAGINFYLFYLIFTPLTLYPVFFLMNLFFNSSLMANNIILIEKTIPIELINACVAGSAYYLLLILNLSTPKIKLDKRIKILLISFLLLLIINIFRIFIMTFFYITNFYFFDITHKIFWYGLSTLFVVLIWFSEVKYFKIKEIPIYSDIKFLMLEMQLKSHHLWRCISEHPKVQNHKNFLILERQKNKKWK